MAAYRQTARRGLRGVAVAVVALLSAAALAGCAEPRYVWGRYPNALQDLYIENDADQARVAIEETLAQLRTIDERRIPPGVFGDYGFLLYQRGDYTGAVAAFEREAALFPESAALMNKLIAKVRERQGGADAAAAPKR